MLPGSLMNILVAAGRGSTPPPKLSTQLMDQSQCFPLHNFTSRTWTQTVKCVWFVQVVIDNVSFSSLLFSSFVIFRFFCIKLFYILGWNKVVTQ